MAKIHALLERIEDAGLRAALSEEFAQASKHKKFGLVFEEHLPECTPLWGMKIRRGMTVARKDGDFNDVLVVQRIKDGVATCWHASASTSEEVSLSDLIPIARFGDPIYPVLTPIDAVENAPGDKLWHTLIQADNYHALQLLEYLYKGKVDCIYIDPPYNTGARDWKYNNDYVDSNDAYRHSKWLSMMQKRLRIAKKLLNPKDSVLIVTIDEKEYLHLGMLLEEMFPEARIQMISSCIMPGGVSRLNQFSRCDEYIYCVQFGDSAPCSLPLSSEWLNGVQNTSKTKVHWEGLLRTGTNNMRGDRPNLFYPVIVSEDGAKFLGAGNPLPITVDRHTYEAPNGAKAIWPIHKDGSEGCWRVGRDTLIQLYEKHIVRLGGFTERGMAINYLKKGEYAKVVSGEYKIKGVKEDNSYDLDDSDYLPKYVPATQWVIPSHDASRHGSGMLLKLFLDKRFSFPKSLYAEHDAIRFFVANKPKALIVDFFAGSGTTLHAVNLLNAEDGGHRRCIMVTNNEVSEAEEKTFRKQGLEPGDPAWEAKGIAQYVTWPRTQCSIKGVNVQGEPLKGEYITVKGGVLGDRALPMSEGFKTNATFFKLDFVDKDSVSLGKQFKELLPILWMKSGAKGKCPKVTQQTPPMLVLPENEFAVLTDEASFLEFEKQVKESVDIRDVYLVTDSNNAFKEMSLHFKGKRCIQLYRDYLDNFRINKGMR